MPLYDLIIRNGTLVTPEGLVHADLAVENERIAAIGLHLEGGAGTELDASGLHVFPGLIDTHVHFNEPGRSEWEGFATGTRALAAGGATCFFDMPLNSSPPTLDAASFQLKLAAAQASAQVDFALWGGLVPGSLDRMDELAACGVVGFKAFMSNSGIADFPAVDDLTLYEGMDRAVELGRIVAVHAENDTLTAALARRAVAEGRSGVRDYLASRPVAAELEAIQRAILFADETGCALHIVHVSSGRGVLLVAEAQARGVNVSCETCPHYLVLTEEDVERLGAVAKCAPPLRPKTEQEPLWIYLAGGSLPMVVSDHSPAPPEMKGLTLTTDEHLMPKEPASSSLAHSSPSFFTVWGGISGCQSTLALLLTAGYYQHGLPLTTIASVTAGYAAQRFKLPHKGRIALDYDADLALVDLAADYTLEAADLHYRHRISPYVGRSLRGRVLRTLLRGRIVFADGQFTDAGGGKLVTPTS